MKGLRKFLGLERNIIVVLSVIVILGMGEELWTRFIPKYLELLGASAWVIAAYGTTRDFLDAVYQYPGGWITDNYGRRKALAIFTLLAIVGYSIYLFSTHWIGIILGTIFVMAWSSLTLPAFFAIIGDNLSQERRAIGFGVQSILKRIPIVVAPSLGGLLVISLGFVQGIRVGLMITILLAVTATIIVLRYYRHDSEPKADQINFRSVWHQMHPYLKRLLIADCLARWAEGIPKVFIILYALNVLHITPFQFGWLTSIQMLAAIVVYIPLAKLSDRLNRKPFILLTFGFFALFPLALVNASSFTLIIAAFLAAGLREIGEPARKALIVDLARETARGRAVGMYYLVRGLVVFPASLIGGWLWTINNKLPFYAAFIIGIFGFVFYAMLKPMKHQVVV
jgi:MFS family permease